MSLLKWRAHEEEWDYKPHIYLFFLWDLLICFAIKNIYNAKFQKMFDCVSTIK